ncbi:hypothetical protein [Ferruginibacter albus]|uniref:hypothetical protein n=1 Tax=Ferruginibacter albus TaxID=2875540 RepID=UPI001CC6FD1B|nr:hypothetical protein [Ferruginibacter albus]UAY52928.1 hypothetical protein K9M53_04430 [Ferruginibacter albus]
MTAAEATFEVEKNRKAFIYTLIICIVLLLLAIIIGWKTMPPPVAPVQDLIEVNLGNDNEGWGKEQPMIKGEMSPSQQQATEDVPQKAAAAPDAPAQSDNIDADESNNKDEAPVTKAAKTKLNSTSIVSSPAVKKPTKSTIPTPNPTLKPKKPLIQPYNGPGKGNGNGANEDNGFRNQGNDPNSKGDAGVSTGTLGGTKIIKGDRKIIRYYSFKDDLPKNTINAIIKVSAAGKGTFIGFDKNSSSRNKAYAVSIAQKLSQIQFDKADHESTITVQFNFTVN